MITCPQNGPKLSVIKILSPEVVILGAVNGLVMKWSIAEQDLRKAPQRHAASIFSVDGNLVRKECA